jgi:hypothetical protein
MIYVQSELQFTNMCMNILINVENNIIIKQERFYLKFYFLTIRCICTKSKINDSESRMTTTLSEV